jgi:hypothetical protein
MVEAAPLAGWVTWVGVSMFMGGVSICILGIESYANERRDPPLDRFGTATVFHEAWLVGWVAIDAGVYLMFETAPGDIAGIMAAAYLLMFPLKLLLRPHR